MKVVVYGGRSQPNEQLQHPSGTEEDPRDSDDPFASDPDSG